MKNENNPVYCSKILNCCICSGFKLAEAIEFGDVYGTWTTEDCNFHLILRNQEFIKTYEVDCEM